MRLSLALGAAVAASSILLLALSPALRAAGSGDPHWPCVQRKVPEITAGIVWSGPAIEENSSGWRKDKTTKDLVRRLAQRRLPLDRAKKDIEAFATAFDSEKVQQLSLLFTGLLQTINQERREIMSGIERYAKRQLALAGKIKESRHEFAALLQHDAPSAEQAKRRDALEQELSWDTRIFDERQQSLTYVCEAPVLLEQRLFALGRKILEQIE